MASEELLEALGSSDEQVVAATVRKCTDRLRAAEWDAAVLVGVSQKLLSLAGHACPRVRQGVADAAPYLPEGAFQSLVTRFAKDQSPYVRDSAERAERRRSALRRAAVKDEEHDHRVQRWYRELEKHKGARATAQRIAAHETEYFVRRMHHEAAASFLPFSDMLGRLRAALEQPELDREQLKALVERVQERCEHLRHVIDTAKQQARTVEPDFRAENLRVLVADQVEVLLERFPDRAARIEVDLSEVDAEIAIEVDANFLKQAFANILKNAVEAYRGDGPIAVSVSARVVASGTQVAIAIADQGCGMDENSVKHAFVPFGSSKPGGTGFGLFIAQKVARQIHGGELKLASKHGAGTTVTMTLPLRQESGRAKRAKR